MANRYEVTITPYREEGALLDQAVDAWLLEYDLTREDAEVQHTVGGGMRLGVVDLGSAKELFLTLRTYDVHADVCVKMPGSRRKKKKKKARRKKKNPRANARGGDDVQYKGFGIHAYARKKRGGYGGFIMLDVPADPLTIPAMYDSKAAVIAAGKKRVDAIVTEREEHAKKTKLSPDQHYKGYQYHTMLSGDEGWGTGGTLLPWRHRDGGDLSTVQGWISGGFPSRAAAAKAAKKMIDLVLGGMSYTEARETVTPKAIKKAYLGRMRPGVTASRKAAPKKAAKKKAAKKASRKAAPKRAPARKAKKKSAKKATTKRKSQDDKIEALRRKLRRG